MFSKVYPTVFVSKVTNGVRITRNSVSSTKRQKVLIEFDNSNMFIIASKKEHLLDPLGAVLYKPN